MQIFAMAGEIPTYGLVTILTYISFINNVSIEGCERINNIG
jgi:hypothetical protein